MALGERALRVLVGTKGTTNFNFTAAKTRSKVRRIGHFRLAIGLDESTATLGQGQAPYGS
jgi:hypothetical protein